MAEVRVLSFHAEYRCRHAGACCTSNWPIPVEADRLGRLQAAIATGQLRPALIDPRPANNQPADAPPESPALLGREHGICVFYDGPCRIHAALGHEALPLACRQFPRVCLHDPRGVSVTLSHYCPTAAAMLEAAEGAPLMITTVAPAFPAAGEYVGLDARDALPPLLRRDMLMDFGGWVTSIESAWALLEAGAGVRAADLLLRHLVQ